jgi:hypothetical protein
MSSSLRPQQDVPTDEETDSETYRRKDVGVDKATADCRVIVLANHKGGVTRTTSTANLG